MGLGSWRERRRLLGVRGEALETLGAALGLPPVFEPYPESGWVLAHYLFGRGLAWQDVWKRFEGAVGEAAEALHSAPLRLSRTQDRKGLAVLMAEWERIAESDGEGQYMAVIRVEMSAVSTRPPRGWALKLDSLSERLELLARQGALGTVPAGELATRLPLDEEVWSIVLEEANRRAELGSSQRREEAFDAALVEVIDELVGLLTLHRPGEEADGDDGEAEG